MRQNIINPETSYTFSDYFKMRVSTEDIVEYFGYSKENARLQLPSSNMELPFLNNLFDIIEDALLHISLENEITRREFLIAPVMAEVRRLTNSKLRSEYWFEYNHQLKGSFDYFLRSENNLLVIEAKDADMTRGFTQLSAEMIALDKADDTDQKVIYGAITTGNIWQFGKLERENKMISQDIKNFDLIQDLEVLVRILVGILEEK
jgi:hypothetical protein